MMSLRPAVLALAAVAGASLLPCTDISDPWTCVDHSDLSIHICSWCASAGQRGCHPVGLSNCSASCCVSRASMSECAMDEVKDLGNSSCDGSFARVRSSAGARAASGAVGVGFSGGGSRAFTTAMGWVRALQGLGLWRADLTVTSVSGSSWFLGPFSYAPGGETDDALRGPYVPPEELTLARVSSAAGTYASLPGDIITKCVELLVERATYSSAPLSHIWRDAIFETFLEPAGIGVNQPFFASAAAAAAAASRNAAILAAVGEAPLVPRNESFPDVVFVGAIEGPAALIPLENNTYLPLAMGPTWTGTHGLVDVPYEEHWPATARGTYAIGGYVETWAFGGVPVAAGGGGGDDEARLALPRHLFSLNNAVGIASMAPAALLTHLPEVLAAREGEARRFSFDTNDDGDGGSGLLSLVPTFRLWAPSEGVAPDDPPDFFAVGDGGDLDNYGILHLLQRGIDRIVVFDASEGPLAPAADWDPYATNATADLIDLYIPPLFGEVVSPNLECNVQNNHVFAREGLPRLVAALQAANATGGGAVASVEVTTVANPLFGIDAGRTVDLSFVYLDLPQRWLDALPKETSDAIRAGDKFPHFPDYATITHLDLSPDEVSLLSQLCSWVVHNNSAFFAEKLAAAAAE